MSTGYTVKTKEEIANLVNQLKKIRTDWVKDGCMPHNPVIKDGLGTILAEVSRWCGGFQDPHHPQVIGWKANNGTRSESGVILVKGAGMCSCCSKPTDVHVKEAIEEAKVLALAALKEL